MLSKSEEIAFIAPIIHGHHHSKFEVDLIVYLGSICRNHVTLQIFISTMSYHAENEYLWCTQIATNRHHTFDDRG